MNPNKLTCPIFTLEYNNQENEPRILTCGHTICLYCLKILMQSQAKNLLCPLCKKKLGSLKRLNLDNFPKNYALLELVEDTKTYQTHRSAVEMVCLDCEIEMCPKCIRSHQGHNIESYEDFRSEVEYKVNKLRALSKQPIQPSLKFKKMIENKRNSSLAG